MSATFSRVVKLNPPQAKPINPSTTRIMPSTLFIDLERSFSGPLTRSRLPPAGLVQASGQSDSGFVYNASRGAKRKGLPAHYRIMRNLHVELRTPDAKRPAW